MTMMNEHRTALGGGEARSSALASLELVENAAVEASEGPLRALRTWDEPEPPEVRQPAPEPHTLSLSHDSIARGVAVRTAFEHAPAGSEIAERLLEEFASGEVPIVRELQNVEGALVALLGRAVTDPILAVRVASVLKETVAVSAAVRRRVEGSLQAAASLRTQRAFLGAHRRGIAGSRGE